MPRPPRDYCAKDGNSELQDPGEFLHACAERPAAMKELAKICCAGRPPKVPKYRSDHGSRMHKRTNPSFDTK